MEQTNNVGKRLRELLSIRGIKSKELAEFTNTSPQTISKILNGKCTLSVKLATKIASFLRTTPDYILCKTDILDIQSSDTIEKIFDADLHRFRILLALELYKALDFTFVEKIMFEDETFSLNYSDDSSGIIGYLSNKPRSPEEESSFPPHKYSEDEIIKYIKHATIPPKHIMEISYNGEIMSLEYCDYLRWINNFIENTRTTALQQLHTVTSNPVYMDEISKAIEQQKLDIEQGKPILSDDSTNLTPEEQLLNSIYGERYSVEGERYRKQIKETKED